MWKRLQDNETKNTSDRRRNRADLQNWMAWREKCLPTPLANPITGRRLRVLFGECSLEALREPLPFVWVAGYLRFTFLFSPTDMKMTASAHIAKDVVELGALRTLPLVAHCLSVYS